MGTVDDFVAEAHQRLLRWRDKALHGEFVQKIDSGGDFTLSFRWLMYGRLKIQTEAQVIAAQDQALAVRAVQNRIYGLSVPLNCKVCGMVPEHVDHLLSTVAVLLWQLLCTMLKIQTEAQVIAAQDQALAVRAVQNRIYGLSVPLNCKVCGMVPEHVDHLLSTVAVLLWQLLCTNKGMTGLQVLFIGAF